MTILEIMRQGPVIPVVIIDEVAKAVPLADALASGGIHVIEITLRSKAALDCIKVIAAERPQMLVGAGTVLTAKDMASAKAAGAKFVVSPGAYPSLLASARQEDVPFLPGTATPSEMMALMAEGLYQMKFFPASRAGGAPFLKALASPLSEAVFCPTGGITPETAAEFLTLDNVACIGGSWVAAQPLLRDGDFDAITRNAKACAELKH